MKISTRTLALGTLITVAIGALAWLWRGSPRPPLLLGNVDPPTADIPIVADPEPVVLHTPSEPCAANSTNNRVAANAESVATLRVLVQSKEESSPLCDIWVVAFPTDGSAQVASVGSGGWSTQSVVTNVEGYADLDVPSDVDLVVHAGDHRGHSTGTTIGSLRPGRSVELLLELPTRVGTRVFGRLVDAQDETALQGRVLVEGWSGDFERWNEVVRTIETDLAGNFELTLEEWVEVEATAEADDHSPTSFGLGPKFDDPARPLIVRLSRAAVLEVLVRDRTGAPRAGASVVLAGPEGPRDTGQSLQRWEPKPDPTWGGTTDVDGALTLTDLPPSVPMRVSFSVPGSPMQYMREALLLFPGEHRRIELLLGPGTRIIGRLEDERRGAIPWCTMWRVAAKEPTAGAFQSTDRPLQTTKTDGEGRFRFEAVPPGTWWIGPAPGASKGLPALAEVASVPGAIPEIEIVVRVDRDLFIEGTVLDPAGSPAAGASVTASWTLGTACASTRSDVDGNFSLGPLMAGSWRVSASSSRTKHESSESTDVEAGRTGLVLQLHEPVTADDSSGKR